MSNREIKIIYTKESGRPPLYTTEANLPNQDKFFRNIIQEVVLVEDEKSRVSMPVKQLPKNPPIEVSPTGAPKFIEPPKPLVITDEMLFAELEKRGKTRKQIENFLKPKKTVVSA